MATRSTASTPSTPSLLSTLSTGALDGRSSTRTISKGSNRLNASGGRSPSAIDGYPEMISLRPHGAHVQPLGDRGGRLRHASGARRGLRVERVSDSPDAIVRLDDSP